ncbi:hypothetical protein Slin15195_G016470 [Septoria linicola]|uniref:Uncharacterized protein n=1 Tax=Septoria linicola TaxID=215465 RepID=A0A9Q9ALJ4_9PEZI|nr:hypothetical protein Slin14017_G016540 [Septoria linicola]USW48328.1 hypothetical protein Slin15195_G016470 [Septoria linicola]
MATNKVRIYALTGAVAAITATGAWYGAGLNMRQEYSREKTKAYEATTEEKLAQLQAMRTQLVRTKEELQIKIDKLQGKELPPPSATANTAAGMEGTIKGRTRTT